MKKYTISIYTENIVGLLSRLTAVFTRRHINIESLTVSETEKKGISRFTVAVKVKQDMAKKITKQINKIVEVVHVEYHEDVELISSQLALYKIYIGKESRLRFALEALAAQNNARILVYANEYMVIEKTGNRTILEGFLEALKDYGETEYVRSGRVSLTPESIRLSEVLPQLADMNNYPNYQMAQPY